MKKVFLLSLFCFAFAFGYSQCNYSVLFPLSNKYEIVDGDTVGDYATIRIGNDSSMFAQSIQVNFTDTFTIEYKPIKIPFKVINHSDIPLVFTRVNWGGETIMVNYTKEAALKGDSLVGRYTTSAYLNRRPGLFTKTSTVKTNQCQWVVYFKGFVSSRAKRDED